MSTSVHDTAKTGASNASFEGLYEEWYCKANSTETSETDRNMGVVGCIGTVQAALLQQHKDDPSYRQALLALLHQAQWNHDASSSNWIEQPQPQHHVASHDWIDVDLPSQTENNQVVDDFFEDYPECLRQDREDDGDDDEEDEMFLVQNQNDSNHKNTHHQKPEVISLLGDEQFATEHQHHREARKVRNPYNVSKQTKESPERGRNENSPPTNPFQTAAEYCGVQEDEQQHNNRRTTHQGEPNYNMNARASSSSAWDDYGRGGVEQFHHNQAGAWEQLPAPSFRNNPYAKEPQAPPPRREIVRNNIPESLKRKFQPPARKSNNNNPPKKRNGNMLTKNKPTDRDDAKDEDVEDDVPEELQGLDQELVEKIQNEILESGDSITFDDIAGLESAKQTVKELVCWPMQRPDIFTGLRRAPNGLLLFGPPGTGKTLIGKAIAHESGACFFAISSSSLTSKWIGEGEKLVRTLFAVAASREPSVVFIDEIDSLLTQRKADENEASRRIKTEFLVQLDGTTGQGQKRVLVIGATNRPHELDDAARRRFVKRLYIPLPEREDRKVLLQQLLTDNHHLLTETDLVKLAQETKGFSGADLKALCTEAAMGPIRELGPRALDVQSNQIPPISYQHFQQALCGTKPSVAQADLDVYLEWNKTYGSSISSQNIATPTTTDKEEDPK